MSEKKDRTLKGLLLIINNRASLNWGLTDNLKEDFPLTLPVVIAQVNNKLENLSPEWITAGFPQESVKFL